MIEQKERSLRYCISDSILNGNIVVKEERYAKISNKICLEQRYYVLNSHDAYMVILAMR